MERSIHDRLLKGRFYQAIQRKLGAPKTGESFQSFLIEQGFWSITKNSRLNLQPQRGILHVRVTNSHDRSSMVSIGTKLRKNLRGEMHLCIKKYRADDITMGSFNATVARFVSTTTAPR
jgi:hypothetical protein